MNTLVMDTKGKHYIKSSTVQICIFRVVRAAVLDIGKEAGKMHSQDKHTFLHWSSGTIPLSSNSLKEDSAETSFEQNWRKKSAVRPRWPLFFT